jgi:putative ABC transport system permease protein
VLARTPGFTLTMVLTLALVIGANTAVFSLINAVLLRQLPFPEADRLVLLSESREGAPISNTAPVRIEEWNEASTAFASITGYYTEDVSETSGDLPEKFRRARVAPRFMDVWGVEPALGRGFAAEENEDGAPAVVLISHRFWTTHLRADPNVLQRQLRLGDQEFSIIGVMPASFRFPDRSVDLWTPRIYESFVLQRMNLWYSAYGRLKPGVTPEQARADLTVIQARLAEQYPETDEGVGVYVAPLQDSIVGGIRGSLWIVFGAVSILLLIAATNVAALVLARAARRNQEVAVRLSLGAPRSAWSQSLTETHCWRRAAPRWACWSRPASRPCCARRCRLCPVWRSWRSTAAFFYIRSRRLSRSRCSAACCRRSARRVLAPAACSWVLAALKCRAAIRCSGRSSVSRWRSLWCYSQVRGS